MTTTKQTFTAIRSAMARAFFANAYADQAEEALQPLGGEILDQLPDVIDPNAEAAALELCEKLADQFDYNERGLSLAQKVALLFLKACRADFANRDRELTAENFGHYLAMQAMGTGVGLEAFGSDVRDAIPVPYLEFGSAHLSQEYFLADVADD
ncbi:hypothetical protein [Bacteriophage Phobos]|uniref:Uncharacterized protein n=1 Tax=Bacteriophage Phobos TaxID=2662138 RepID=A0A5Q2U8C7_9CAUD|nr:hypothetical protein JT319_gp57 [Bacteriophage Phobos]QGH45026.1 hypothetical protein [Bacteriophage Phobos]